MKSKIPKVARLKWPVALSLVDKSLERGFEDDYNADAIRVFYEERLNPDNLLDYRKACANALVYGFRLGVSKVRAEFLSFLDKATNEKEIPIKFVVRFQNSGGDQWKEFETRLEARAFAAPVKGSVLRVYKEDRV